MAPYVHYTPQAYRQMAAASKLDIERLDIEDTAWNLETREAFVSFAETTFVEWTRCIPHDQHIAFINDVLDNYARIGNEPNVFRFYQMVVVLRPA